MRGRRGAKHPPAQNQKPFTRQAAMKAKPLTSSLFHFNPQLSNFTKKHAQQKPSPLVYFFLKQVKNEIYNFRGVNRL
ncbi:hypothetical protein X474_13185 [Dethiosulfatarculus sandiegensis]|uniref:Uncharacterized protein n=1 Tax=Dethiosulfatarculus sandiegensis TaxID=1429043 RepID=A0A0D2JWV0_9BACT|nr:hypothetical protein X474_13185 [Dethiosulfatarculus sandiegensis]